VGTALSALYAMIFNVIVKITGGIAVASPITEVTTIAASYLKPKHYYSQQHQTPDPCI
jgi:hypothetical protein